jgi:hypothetical protein
MKHFPEPPIDPPEIRPDCCRRCKQWPGCEGDSIEECQDDFEAAREEYWDARLHDEIDNGKTYRNR